MFHSDKSLKKTFTFSFTSLSWNLSILSIFRIFLFSRLLNKFHPLQKPNNIFKKYAETKIF